MTRALAKVPAMTAKKPGGCAVQERNGSLPARRQPGLASGLTKPTGPEASATARTLIQAFAFNAAAGFPEPSLRSASAQPGTATIMIGQAQAAYGFNVCRSVRARVSVLHGLGRKTMFADSPLATRSSL